METHRNKYIGFVWILFEEWGSKDWCQILWSKLLCQKETVSDLLPCWCMIVCFLFLTLLFTHTYFYRLNFCRKPPAWLLYIAFLSCTTFYVSCELFIFTPYLCLWKFLMCTRRSYSLFGSDCCVQLVEIVLLETFPFHFYFIVLNYLIRSLPSATYMRHLLSSHWLHQNELQLWTWTAGYITRVKSIFIVFSKYNSVDLNLKMFS